MLNVYLLLLPQLIDPLEADGLASGAPNSKNPGERTKMTRGNVTRHVASPIRRRSSWELLLSEHHNTHAPDQRTLRGRPWNRDASRSHESD